MEQGEGRIRMKYHRLHWLGRDSEQTKTYPWKRWREWIGG